LPLLRTASYGGITVIPGTIDHLPRLLVKPVVPDYSVRGRSGTGIDRGMAGAGTGGRIIEMVVLASEALAYQSLKTTFPVLVPKSGKVIVAHLVHHDAHYKFWGQDQGFPLGFNIVSVFSLTLGNTGHQYGKEDCQDFELFHGLVLIQL